MRSVLSLVVLLLGGLISGLLISCAPAEPRASALPKVEPLVAQRADPFIHRTVTGRYYFIATAPEFDRIEMRAANSLAEIKTAEAKTVWRKHSTGPMGANIWAPELHYFNNSWYIYFAAGDAEKPWLIRMYVLANESADPLTGEWKELGSVQTARDSFSLDATTFEHQGQRYLVWAQKDPQEKFNSALYIAQLISPTQVGDVETEISRPQLDWEIQGYKVNEGAAVIEHKGKIFISYSASATDHRYAMGLLWADADSDLLAASSWHKLQEPVFTSNPALNRYGPGHNSFTKDDYGQDDIMVYHARDYLELQGTPLTDPNRHTYIRRLKWTSEGFPDFGQNKSDVE
ncbi:MAG TPA: family 43 glycosylhydrolase [Cellvibrio sp.]|nr:family 43 glycosylhydrolase [Cellvibrio sp.]